MKRAMLAFLLSGTVAFAANAVGDKSHEPAKDQPQTVSIQGEIVDLGCYLEHGARGEKHKSCAAKCVAGGMPMGLLTPKNKLYVLTLNHDDADPFKKSKELVGSQVEVRGTVAERNGISAIDVVSVKAMTPASGK